MVHKIKSKISCVALSLAALTILLPIASQLFAQKTASTERVKATNVVALRKLVGQQVTVYGRVGTTAKSKSGMNFLNFASSELSAVCRSSDVSKFKPAPADAFRGKDIVLTGMLELYKGKLQIKLTQPEQIKVETLTTSPNSVKPVELKQIGRDTWMSPAGLRYAGRDPQGLTRVAHVARHFKNIPNRNGPHGVFDGGEGVAFAVIDEAWKLAERKKLKANNERDRSSYTVSMGRRIGYLGGRSGAQQGSRPLSRVFIVFETGTKNIITAFPK